MPLHLPWRNDGGDLECSVCSVCTHHGEDAVQANEDCITDSGIKDRTGAFGVTKDGGANSAFDIGGVEVAARDMVSAKASAGEVSRVRGQGQVRQNATHHDAGLEVGTDAGPCVGTVSSVAREFNDQVFSPTFPTRKPCNFRDDPSIITKDKVVSNANALDALNALDVLEAMAEAVFDVAAALERMRIGCNHLANQVIGQVGCKVGLLHGCPSSSPFMNYSLSRLQSMHCCFFDINRLLSGYNLKNFPI